MSIETNLNQSPYFDDFDEDKNFHRVLFRPGFAVQARELTQLQSILQNQLGRLADEVYIDGIIVTGGGLTTQEVAYVKLRDKDANNRVIAISDFFSDNGNTKIANAVVTGVTSGVTGKLVFATTGSEASAPDNFTIHVHYTNSGTNNTTKEFADGETLILRQSSNNAFIVAANAISSSATGFGLKANIQDGILYHKENFVRFGNQSVIVSKFDPQPNAYIGFTTSESVIDSNADQSLLDNATGATNFTAPGANRLKIDPVLTVKSFGFANTTSFFRVAEVINGQTVERPLDRNLSTLGKFVAERVYDSSGNFAIEPFNIRVREHLKKTNSLGRYTVAENGDTNKLVAEIETGSAYVHGEKIRLTTPIFLDVDKATDFDTSDAVVVGQQFGNYVNAKEVVGTWDFQGLRTVSLRNTRQHGISGENLGAQAVSGTEIGTARVRGFQYDSGTPGTYNAQFRIYLFDIQMNSGQSFSSVRGLYVNNASGPKSMADIVLEANGDAKIQEPNLNNLVLPTGITATKTYADSAGANDTQFVYRTEKTVNFSTGGAATVTANTAHAGATETMNETGSPLSNTEERNIIVVARETVETVPHTGTVTQSGNTVTGSGTVFTTAYQVGDFIKIASNDPMRITEITNNTTIKTANTQTVGGASAHSTTFPIGYIFDTSANGTITSTSSAHTINLQQANLASTFSASVYFNRLRSAAVPTSKTVNKNKFVHLNTGSHSASKDGPWPLGASDVFKLEAVYKGSNTGVSSSDTDVTTHFELDDGQKDAFYDTAYLRKKATSSLNITNSGLLVKFSFFGRDRSAGIGYLNIDSYPIDDANTANTTAVTTQEIPLFRSPTTGIARELRDSVDFRPIKTNSVTPSANGVATQTPSITNPSASTTFSIDSDGAHMPTPDENFQADIQFYLPRKDRIVVTPAGNFNVVKGIPDLSPKTPDAPLPSMSLGTLSIPPFPSLAPYFAEQYARTDLQVTLDLDNNRRYTMQDLRAVDSRVKSLEYYSSLNLLENLTLNKQVFNDAGSDRFKNGFFVDNFVNLNFADTSSPALKASIDVNKGHLRPGFQQRTVPMSKTLVDTASMDTANVTKTGDMITLAYTSRELQKQPYASKRRTVVQELLFNWEGEVVLDPPMDNDNDLTTLPELQVDFDGFFNGVLESLRIQGASPVRTTFGRWETTTSVNANRTLRTTTNNRTVTTSTLGSVTETISLGNSVESVSLREFMRSRVVRFTGVRMRPNTRVFAYFDEEKVFDYVTPTNSSFVATGVEGANLVTDSTGTVYGNFRIPNDNDLKFRVGTKRFLLLDIDDPITKTNLVTTAAHGDYSAQALDVTQRDRSINLRVPQVTTTQTTQTTTSVTPIPRPRPPIRNVRQVNFCFVAGTQVRMADGSDKNIEDVQIGEEVLGQDNAVNKVLGFDHNPLEGRTLIGINDSGAFMTEDHPLMTRDGWKAYDSELVKQNKAELTHLMTNGNLQIGDEILTVDGSWVKVTSLEIFLDEPEQTVYNFELDGNNTYFADKMLAHNRCFIAGTKVLVEDGSLKNIEEVQVGEKLVGKDGKLNGVTDLHRPKLNSYDNILPHPLRMASINGGEYAASEDHMFMTTDGWKAPDGVSCAIIHKDVLVSEGMDTIESLKIGDKIITKEGLVEVNSIDIKEDDPELQLYNFYLDGSHTYHVVMDGHEEPMLVHNKDPLAQSFFVTLDDLTSGTYVTKIDLFFAKKDSSLPITLQIRKMENGFPTTEVIASKTLAASAVNTSATGATATTFTFDNLVFLSNQEEYAFVAIPGGNSDQYQVWVAEMGGDDVLLPNTKITKQTAAGVLFSSANDSTWRQFQDEDMKYTIHCAKFTKNTGTVYVEQKDMEYLSIDELDGNFVIGENTIAESVLTFANNQTVTVGQILKSKHAANNNSVEHSGYANGVIREVVGSSSGSVTVKVDPFGTFSTTATGNTNNLYVGATWVGNTTAYTANTAQGTVSFYYGLAGQMHLEGSAGGYSNGYVRGQSSGASARVTSVDNLVMNTLVPKIPQIAHANTTANWSVRTASSAGVISPTYKSIQLSTENTFFDAEKKIFSKSNETALTAVTGSKKTFVLKGTLTTTDDYVSPQIDLSRANMLTIENIINNNTTDEQKTFGNATSRYISKPVTLEDGQDAEDMTIFVDAFKPQGSEISVYARLLNAEDGETLEDKDFTLMTQVTASNTFSAGIDGKDIKEFEFGFSANTDGQNFLVSANNHARLNSANSNVVAYRGTNGSVYHTYKTFALKIVMTATGTHITPKVENIRAIALQK